MTDTSSTQPPTALKSGMYWRKSKLFGHLCPPGILTLDADRLNFRTATETVFTAPVADVTAAFSGWGTLTIKANGTSYDFVGTAGDMSQEFDPSLRRELLDTARDTRASRALNVAGGVAQALAGASALADAAGTAASAGQYAAGVKILKQWPPVLRAAGASVTAKRANNLWWLYGGLAAILLIGVIIVFVQNG